MTITNINFIANLIHIKIKDCGKLRMCTSRRQIDILHLDTPHLAARQALTTKALHNPAALDYEEEILSTQAVTTEICVIRQKRECFFT